ncbi:MAG: MazG nucleotide pyrophosphohydrolase domain-containing protein, partial [Pseudomonadota bacterium]
MDTRDDGRKTLADLLDVMAALRTPDTGCPWDLEQTFATIAPYTIEEAYEVADAIERGDLVDQPGHHRAGLVVAGQRLDHERAALHVLGAARQERVQDRG